MASASSACPKESPRPRRPGAMWSLAVRSGLGASENHCLNLAGICRRDSCKIIEDTIGGCRRRWKCCRAWWVLIPIPTPLVYSEYQYPVGPRLK
ncbi:putative beta-defensin 109B [Molossus molossus]|uniref:putative beta-defensin 109B n=1 Tax=Molossus molossus TaxID=27622 RepID=UPI0017467034|nr:putative beta-defensin 109B [Molossus molossus]